MYDFSGWASKNDLLCSDGRIIRRDAFKEQDGKVVPLVFAHNHNSINDVLGHALLTNKPEGIWADCKLNDSPSGKSAREVLKNGDIKSLSIWANNLVQDGRDVLHGTIREVSIVLAGANPGAFVESVMIHGIPMDDDDSEGIIYTGSDIVCHSDESKKEEDKKDESKKEEDKKDESKKEDKKDESKKEEDKKDESKKEDKKDESKKEEDKTVGEVMDTLTEEQKKAVAIVLMQAISDNEKEDDDVKHNAFEGGDNVRRRKRLTREEFNSILSDAKRLGSLKESVLSHMEDDEIGDIIAHSINTDGMETPKGNSTYGFNDPDMLFPDYKPINGTPEWISRRMDWVQKVLTKVHHTPFSRIKSVYADITEDEARAKGYIKGTLKKEEVFTILKRTTDPQTVYKKQKMDRDDVIDITDFDVIAWIKSEMRIMLDEELARAILLGDGRPSDSDDKIKEDHIRPICKDVSLFNTTIELTSPNGTAEAAKELVDAVIRARKMYKGSGRPTFWTTEDVLAEMLLLEDKVGHKLYKTEAELATTLRVDEIVTVEPMETTKINGKPLLGIIVNLTDYNVGADKGGDISMFEDFDIDYNQQKYLIETRCSGALIKPFSSLTFVAASSSRASSYSSTVNNSSKE